MNVIKNFVTDPHHVVSYCTCSVVTRHRLANNGVRSLRHNYTSDIIQISFLPLTVFPRISVEAFSELSPGIVPLPLSFVVVVIDFPI